MGRLRKVVGHLLRGFVANAIINGRRPAVRLQGPDVGMGPSRVFGSGAYYTRRVKGRRRPKNSRRRRRRAVVKRTVVVPVEVPAGVAPESRSAYVKKVVQSGLKKGGWLAKRLGLAFVGAGAAGAGAYAGRGYMKSYMDRRAAGAPVGDLLNFDQGAMQDPDHLAYMLQN